VPAVVIKKYAEAKVDAENDLPHKFVVSSAKPAEKKEFESGKILLYRLAKREGLAA